ncbi:MAG TPA: hypothetical protein VGF79_07795, partial [Bacteroidia bacterium]
GTLNNLPMMNVSFEKATSRKSSITFSFGFKSGIVTESDYDRFKSRSNKLMVVYNGDETLTFFNGDVRYNQSYFSLSKTFYLLRYGSIAPQGKFIRYGFSLHSYKINKDMMTYSYYDDQDQKISFSHPVDNYKSKKLGFINFEFGSMRFISKNFFIRKAVAFNLPLNFWRTTGNKTFNSIEDFNETNLGYFISNTQKINFSLGLGFAF